MTDHHSAARQAHGPHQQVTDEDWDIWSLQLRVDDAERYMEAVLGIDDRLGHPAPDCSESGVLGPELYEIVIEQPKAEARRQVEALIGHLGIPARIVGVRRAE